MNEPKAIEIAFADVIRRYGLIGEGVTIRAWQSLDRDGTWDDEKDRAFPVVDVRCGPPQTDENERTLFCECAILCGSAADDDKSHAQVSQIYAGVKDVLDALFSQFIQQAAGDELTHFSLALDDELGENFGGVGGLSWGAGAAPYNDAGINMVGATMRVHYSRKDF